MIRSYYFKGTNVILSNQARWTKVIWKKIQSTNTYERFHSHLPVYYAFHKAPLVDGVGDLYTLLLGQDVDYLKR